MTCGERDFRPGHGRAQPIHGHSPDSSLEKHKVIFEKCAQGNAHLAVCPARRRSEFLAREDCGFAPSPVLLALAGILLRGEFFH